MTKAITITPVNDQPDVTFTPPSRVNEDAGLQTTLNFATPANGATQLESAETFSYSLANDNNALFSVQPNISANGTLTYRPEDNQYGTATVTATVRDSGGTSHSAIDTRTKTFQLIVKPNQCFQ